METLWRLSTNIAYDRLLLWYTILTALFRCPSSTSDLTDDSPSVCKPYLQVRSQAAPYVKPYYDRYLKPYADRAQPHVEEFNEKYFSPASAFAKDTFDVYGAPRVAQLHQYAEGTWSSTIKPQLETRRKWAAVQYEEHLAPYVKEVEKHAGPVAQKGRQELVEVYETVIIPLYLQAQPYAHQAYRQGQYMTTEIIFPAIQNAHRTTSDFVGRNVWPTLLTLYGENVEPQLTKIIERLGRYKDTRRLQAPIQPTEISKPILSVTKQLKQATPPIASPVTASIPPSPRTEQATAPSPPPPRETPPRAPSPEHTPFPASLEKVGTTAPSSPGEVETPAPPSPESVQSTPKSPELEPEPAPKSPEPEPTPAPESLEPEPAPASKSPELEPEPEPEPEPERQNKPDPQAEPETSIGEETSTPQVTTPEKAPIPTKSPSPEPAAEQVDTRVQIEGELAQWKSKITAAAEKGGIDLKLRVAEITSRQIENQAHGAGKSLVVLLEETARTRTEQLKAHILSSIRSLSEHDDKKAEDAAYEKIVTEVRNAGSAIKDRATTIRTWETSYDSDTTSLVKAALDSTLKTVDTIRDLGLQQIGMRWADMEGITYEDWSTYHDLKTDFDDWRQDLQDAAFKHEGLAAARSEGDNVREAAMKEAQAAVAELVRLRDVAKWKFAARDDTDDFNTKTGPPMRIHKAANSAISAAAHVADTFSSAARKGLRMDGADEDAGGNSDENDAPIEKDTVISEKDTILSTGEDLPAFAGGKPHDAESSVSSTIIGTSPLATASLSSLSTGSSHIPFNVAEFTDEATASFRVPGGALAADAGSVKQIIWDTPEDGSLEQIQNACCANTPGKQLTQRVRASSKYDQAVSLAKEQYTRGSIAVAGTPKPKSEQAFSSIESAYSASLSLASSKLQSLLGKTSAITKPIPTQSTGILESITSVASAQLQQGLLHASAHFGYWYEKAKSAVGAQPTPAHKLYLAEAQKQYYAGIGLAHDQYSRFLAAASTGVYGTPTPVYESLLSAAKAQYTGAVNAAQSVYDEALEKGKSIAGAATKSPAPNILDSALSQFEAAKLQAAEALSVASASASSVFYGTQKGKAEHLASAASEQILGTETPWNEAMASKAAANWDVLILSASQGIYGTPTPWYQSGYSQAGDYAAQATEAAAAQYEQLSGLISELLVGKEPDFTESVYNRFSSAYHTGLPNVASSASSVASEAYASAASVVTSIFTPPPALEAIFSQATDQLNSAIDAASLGIVGTQPGYIDQASSAARQAASKASTAVYGTPPSYLESAQKNFADIGANANKALSDALYGTPTGTVEAAGSSAALVASSVSSVIADNAAKAGQVLKDGYSAASVRASEVLYGPEKSALESAQARILEAIKSASLSLESLAAEATGALGEGYEAAKSKVEEAASSVSSAAASIKDEL